MSLLERHLGFVESLREAGLAVSLSEDIDAARAVSVVPWDEREALRAAYAATVMKRQRHRVTFDEIFDLWFPPRVGDGARSLLGDDPDQSLDASAGSDGEPGGESDGEPGGESDGEEPRDSARALRDLRERLREALVDDGSDDGSGEGLAELAAEAVGRFGALRGRGPGMAGFSALTAMQRIRPGDLMADLAAGDEQARTAFERRLAEFDRLVSSDANRRVAEQKGAEHVARSVVRPTIDALDLTWARRSDLIELKREIEPLARRLATRLTQERHADRRGPLDFRRTVRASMSTGGVPITTRHRPRRPHRTELVVLCDVSGSVANFAHFTLMLVYALRDQFTKVRAFMFVDRVHEVTDMFRPGADPNDVLTDLSAAASHAAILGRTLYGRVLEQFAEEFPDAVNSRTSLLVLGDARSNHADLAVPVLEELAERARHAWWLNPEHPRQWGVGDSGAREYARVIDMVECRNLTQLGEFVHTLAR